MYLCYDIKGIQQFIFSVPKLKCVIGASGIISAFDLDCKAKYRTDPEAVFTGGGRGGFFCSSRTVADSLSRELVKAAHRDGLDIRIGMDASLSRATLGADRLYPCIPGRALNGEPCSMSGLWPVPEGKGMGPKGDVHPLIWHRALCAKEDRLGGFVLGQLADHPSLRKLAEVAAPQFFKTVSFGPDDPPEERMEAVAGRRALGDQQRWAVVAMDGNDMGRQFRAAQEAGWSDSEFSKWLREMSECLKTCTQRAFLAALGSAIKSWGETLDDDRREECVYEDDEGRHLVLPFRPLVLGGDDVVMLCHPSFAIEFVRDLAEEFQKQSKEAAAGSVVRPLWVATGDELTISGGVLFSKVTFPLHMAIPYAESLLANAKASYRRDPKAAPTSPMPAAVDWDTITDTLVDTPKARRDRELRFFDEELSNEVRLTRRPYPLTATGDSMTLEELLELKNQLGRLPTSLRARILPAVQRPWSERIEFVASVAKRHPVLKEQLWEGEGDMGKAWVSSEDGAQITALPDALLLLEEEHRAERHQ